MQNDSNWLVHDHRKFEETLKECEDAAGAGDWKAAVNLFDGLVDDLKLHMRMEDEVIYPIFREEVDDPEDELGELVDEHDDMARLLNNLVKVIKNQDFDHFEESLTPLYQAMTEHNRHEEQVLSRMSNNTLLNRRDEILNQLQAIRPGSSSRVWEF